MLWQSRSYLLVALGLWLPATVATAEPPDNGGLVLRSADDRIEMTIHGGVQAWYAYTRPDGADFESAFLIRRARLSFDGVAFTPKLGYKIQLAFDRGDAALKDFFIDYRFVDRLLHVRVGQSKRPFSRQRLNPGFRQQLIARSITDEFVGATRDIGIALHNGIESSPVIEWALGLYNGTAATPRLEGKVVVDTMTGHGSLTEGRVTNVPAKLHPMIVGRIGYNHGGIHGYSEGDLEGGGLRFAVAGSGMLDLDADETRDSGIRAEIDGVIKVHGASISGAAYVAWAQARRRFKSQQLAATGFHLQLGYVIAGTYQPVFRYAEIRYDGPDNDRRELLTGLSWYLVGHAAKCQIDGGAVIQDTPTGRVTARLVRLQAQLGF